MEARPICQCMSSSSLARHERKIHHDLQAQHLFSCEEKKLITLKYLAPTIFYQRKTLEWNV
jgi:hypothetical protein